MGKFSNVKLDENGNVSSVTFPHTNLAAEVEFIVSEDGESTPASVTVGGQKLSVDQFQDIQTDSSGIISVKPSAGGDSGNKPWWWDFINGIRPGGGNGNIHIGTSSGSNKNIGLVD